MYDAAAIEGMVGRHLEQIGCRPVFHRPENHGSDILRVRAEEKEVDQTILERRAALLDREGRVGNEGPRLHRCFAGSDALCGFFVERLRHRRRAAHLAEGQHAQLAGDLALCTLAVLNAAARRASGNEALATIDRIYTHDEWNVYRLKPGAAIDLPLGRSTR